MKSTIIILSIFLLSNTNCFSISNEHTNLGKFTEAKLNQILDNSNKLESNSSKIEYISRKFLDTPYQENTLIGSDKTKEALTINLEGVDCFTYLDYVESLRLSKTFENFKNNLIKTRYKENKVSYTNRNHFFSDWGLYNDNIENVTTLVGGNLVEINEKKLNQKDSGNLYLNKIPVVIRDISYIPTKKINGSLLKNLRTGDYIGLYTDRNGLDVSHTGILVKSEGKVYLRHASSREKNRKVVDEELLEYLKNKPGIVVFRAK